MSEAVQRYIEQIRKVAESGKPRQAAPIRDRLIDQLEELNIIAMVETVEEFMRACGHTTGEYNEAQGMLFWKLYEKKAKELEHAFWSEDGVAEIDGIVDTIWVLIGLALSQGHDIRGAFKEVARFHRDTIMPGGKVRRREDGKILKPEGWKPPQLGEFAGF